MDDSSRKPDDALDSRTEPEQMAQLPAPQSRLPTARIEPLRAGREPAIGASRRYLVECTIGSSTYEKLLHIQALLREAGSSDDLPEVFDLALRAYLAELNRSR